MQPYAIRKHRQLSMQSRFLIATIVTTVGVYAYKRHIYPVLHRWDQKQYKDFAEDYFNKHENTMKNAK